MKILVIYGGFGLSQEAEISELSGKQIAAAVKAAGFETTEFLLTKDNLIELQSQLTNFDVVFPVLHGEFGEDGGIQRILESANVKYVGSDAISSQLCFDKSLTQAKLKSANILIPKFQIIASATEFDHAWLPCVIKPLRGGSSVDIFIWKTTADLHQLTDLSAKYGTLMIEQYIQGRELTVGVLDNTALPVIEIIPPTGEWFDYENKYSGKSQEIPNPPNIPITAQQHAQEIALAAHQLCGCRHLSRVDFILQNDQLYCLEINTMPGMTGESLYPKAVKAFGYDLPTLVRKLIELA